MDILDRIRMVAMHPVIPEKSFFKQPLSWVIIAVILGVFYIFLGSIMTNFNGLSRGKIKRTSGDMKTLAIELEEYRSISGHYPVAADIDGVIRLLPHSASGYPFRDGWQSPYRYQAVGGDPAQCKPGANPQPPSCGPLHYTLASAGADGKFSREKLTEYEFGETNDYSCDLVIRDGKWLRQPSGKQSRGACRSE